MEAVAARTNSGAAFVLSASTASAARTRTCGAPPCAQKAAPSPSGALQRWHVASTTLKVNECRCRWIALTVRQHGFARRRSQHAVRPPCQHGFDLPALLSWDEENYGA